MGKYGEKLRSKSIRADPDFVDRVKKIMEEQKMSERAATFQIEKKLREMEERFKNQQVRF